MAGAVGSGGGGFVIGLSPSLILILLAIVLLVGFGVWKLVKLWVTLSG